MSQICNGLIEDPFDTLLGSAVERRVERGSAFFSGGFAEMLHFVAARELHRPDDLARHVDTAIAYLEASVAEYDRAIIAAERLPEEDGLAREVCALDYTALYHESIRRGLIPEMPAAWAELAATGRTEAPSDLLRVFREAVQGCLRGVGTLQGSWDEDALPEVDTVWAVITQLIKALATGQAIAVIYQTPVRKSGANVAEVS